MSGQTLLLISNSITMVDVFPQMFADWIANDADLNWKKSARSANKSARSAGKSQNLKKGSSSSIKNGDANAAPQITMIKIFPAQFKSWIMVRCNKPSMVVTTRSSYGEYSKVGLIFLTVR